MKEKEQAIEPAVLNLMRDIGKLIHDAIQQNAKSTGEKYGFALLMFGLTGEEPSRMNYISDCDREDMLAAMKEFIARNEGTYEPGSLVTTQ